MDFKNNGKVRTALAPSELKYFVSERELAEAKAAAEDAKRAWQEEHDARIEAEEAKEAVIKSAEMAIEEVNEFKKKLAGEIEKARVSAHKALQAKRLYEEARVQTEAAKKIWREACRARISGRPYEKMVVEAKEAEQRAEYTLQWLE